MKTKFQSVLAGTSRVLVDGKSETIGMHSIQRRPSAAESIEQSDLPDNVKSLIHLVIKRSRLWPSEKCSVANELINHFEDGLRRNKDVEKLISDFGDPILIAQFIRNSKKRNRSMTTKLLYGGLWGFALFVLSYFGLTAFHHMGKANPTHDYEAEMNHLALSLPEEQTAWSIYRGPFAKFDFAEEGDSRFGEIYIYPEGDWRKLVRPKDANWQTIIAKLEESEELLEAFRAARTKTRLGLPLYANWQQYSDEDLAALFPKRNPGTLVSHGFIDPEFQEILRGSLYEVLLPHYSCFRLAARLLVVDSRLAVEQNDFERITQNIESILAFSVQLGNEPILIGDFQAFGLQTISFDLVDELLPQHLDRFSDAQLKRIQLAITNSDPVSFVDLTGERTMTLDIFQRCFTHDGNGNGRITSKGYELIRNIDTLFSYRKKELGLESNIAARWQSFVAPLKAVNFPSRKQVESEYLAQLEKCQLELNRSNFFEVSLDELEPDDTNTLLKSMFLPVKQLAVGMFGMKGNQEATATAVAICRYQKKHGKLPRQLDELLDDYLDQLPIDQCTGQPLQYRLTDDGFTLYSFGRDRIDNDGKRGVTNTDKTDENGAITRPQASGEYHIFGHQPNTDWVLWPRLSEEVQ
jgi:hypothetical protein